MGKLIVLEGTDGSGKSTQFQLVTQRLAQAGATFRQLVFPQYAEPSSALIRMYLNGEFGPHPVTSMPMLLPPFTRWTATLRFRKSGAGNMNREDWYFRIGIPHPMRYIKGRNYRKLTERPFFVGWMNLNLTGWVCLGRIWSSIWMYQLSWPA